MSEKKTIQEELNNNKTLVPEKTFFEKYSTAIGILISSFITIFGWTITTNLNIEKDRKIKLLDIKNQYISTAFKEISFYNTLMNNNIDVSKDDFRNFERALKDIQLYGSLQEIKLTISIIENIKTKNYSLDPLLNLLRDNLRQNYDLEKVEGNTYWIIDTSLYKKKN